MSGIIPTRVANVDSNAAADINTLSTFLSSLTFTLSGVSIVGENQISFMVPRAITVTNVFIKVDTAPTGASLDVDINNGGTTIFSNQSKRPMIPASSSTDTSETPDAPAFSQNSILSISVDQVGSTIPGGDNLYIRVEYTT